MFIFKDFYLFIEKVWILKKRKCSCIIVDNPESVINTVTLAKRVIVDYCQEISATRPPANVHMLPINTKRKIEKLINKHYYYIIKTILLLLLQEELISIHLINYRKACVR